jgi:hypothetical protein
MFDEYTPPPGVATAFSVGCFVNAENPDGAPADWRRGGDDFIGTGNAITGVKIWARYNASGYTSGRRPVGFCVRFHTATDPVYCPDGTVDGLDAIGPVVYDEYVGLGSFTEEEIFSGLIRNFAYCLTLPVPFANTNGAVYWLDLSIDYDLVVINNEAYSQIFWRAVDDGFQYDPFCEASVRYCDDDVTCAPWDRISVAVAVPGWAGWDAAFKLYAAECVVFGACCFTDGSCSVQSSSDCEANGGLFQGANTVCDPNPCFQPEGACCIETECLLLPADLCAEAGGNFLGAGTNCDPNPCVIPTLQKSWGQIKGEYR